MFSLYSVFIAIEISGGIIRSRNSNSEASLKEDNLCEDLNHDLDFAVELQYSQTNATCSVVCNIIYEYFCCTWIGRIVLVLYISTKLSF